MALAFDGTTKIVTITTDTTLNVLDLWSRWVDWWLTGDNSKYGIAMEQVGGNDIDIGSGTSIPIYIFLKDGWRVKPKELDHTLAVTTGILLVDGGGDPFLDTTGAYTVRVNYQQPVQAITVSTGGGSAPTAAQVADAVWEELQADHTTAGSVAETLKKAKDKAALAASLSA